MKTLAQLMLASLVLFGCEVEASLGAHDAAVLNDAHMCAATSDAGACGACEAAMCCEAFLACAADPVCPCIVDCVLAGMGTVAACTTHCGGMDHGEHVALTDCARRLCAACP